jgi:hypothetical protein
LEHFSSCLLLLLGYCAALENVLGQCGWRRSPLQQQSVRGGGGIWQDEARLLLVPLLLSSIWPSNCCAFLLVGVAVAGI